MPAPPKPNEDRERSYLIVASAGIAMHALIAAGKGDSYSDDHLISRAFDLATKFITEAEKRFGKLE